MYIYIYILYTYVWIGSGGYTTKESDPVRSKSWMIPVKPEWSDDPVNQEDIERCPTPGNVQLGFDPLLKAPPLILQRATSLPPRPEPRGPTVRTHAEFILESHQGTGNSRFTLPRIFFWCDSRIHWIACFLCAFIWKLASSLNSWKEPCPKTALRSVASMFLVRGSANRNAVGIHPKLQCSKHLSLIRRTSSVVRYSAHEGIARRLTKSHKDLQSVTTTAACIWRKASGGFLQWNSRVGTSSSGQRSTCWKLPQTKSIALLLGAVWFWWSWDSWGVVAKTSVPWKQESCFGLANDASPNATWVSWFGSMDLKKILTSHVCCGSRRTLLASNKVKTVGFDSWTCISPNLAAMSALVFVVAYCKLPMKPRRCDISDSDTGSCAVLLRCFPISRGKVEFT